ncbi:HemK2/MTQ2 family protein methyltransferase [Catellatospora bangladeshensis]|uniref:Methyltransferase n=1 Tax=Catellatospora bangladeshensis TaxID=310355 RepID=A0A8J3JJ38_9ACTN|nr:HemK2/MTQ2 family protein methyltransferase [Catellatospora bangladeshensis]GIF83504.1 methyltransferase [Catellatospora bangladeshensis]
MRLIRLPGVHSPVSDTWMLAEAMGRETLAGARVADLCTGTGALAIVAALAGASQVTAVDLTWRASCCAVLNARLHRVRVNVRRGDLWQPLHGETFDLIVSNPPYIPAATDEPPRRAALIPLDAGRGGRALLDRLCRDAPAHLSPGGSILLVHSSICGTDESLIAMRQAGLRAEVVLSRTGPLGPVMRQRAAMMRRRGQLGVADVEDIVVVRGTRPR